MTPLDPGYHGIPLWFIQDDDLDARLREMWRKAYELQKASEELGRQYEHTLAAQQSERQRPGPQ